MNKADYTIMRARPEDAADLLAFRRIVGGETDNLSYGAEGSSRDVEAETDYLRRVAASGNDIMLLAKSCGEIIGMANLIRKHKRMSHRGELGICVRKDYWGCGVASALMEQILSFAKECGIEQVNLEVRSDNTRAIRLYERFGFKKLCTFPAFYKINEQYIDFDLMNLDFKK